MTCQLRPCWRHAQLRASSGVISRPRAHVNNSACMHVHTHKHAATCQNERNASGFGGCESSPVVTSAPPSRNLCPVNMRSVPQDNCRLSRSRENLRRWRVDRPAPCVLCWVCYAWHARCRPPNRRSHTTRNKINTTNYPNTCAHQPDKRPSPEACPTLAAVPQAPAWSADTP